MQLRTVVFILLILAVFAARAGAQSKDPAALRQNLLSLSGLKEGPIELIDGNEDCIASTLRIVPIDEDDHFTLTISLGAQPLIMGLGVKETRYSERGCTSVETATVANRQVHFLKTQKCGEDGAFEYRTDLMVNDTGFEYTKENRDLKAKKTTLKRTCKYRFAR